MPRKKTVVNRYTVTTNEVQEEALKKLMKDDMQDSVSQYFGMMIAEISKNREGKQRRAVGRPKKNDTEDAIKEKEWYLAPYDPKAPPYTFEDLKAYYEFRNQEMPVLPPPLTKEELKQWDM